VGDVANLLDFATTIEFYRQLALQKMEDALKIQRSYQVNDDGATKLTDEEVKQLRDYRTNGSTLRSIYMDIVLQYCQWVRHLQRCSVLKYLNRRLQDIYHICTSDPPRAADLTLRLCQYFPELSETPEKSRAESPYLFHHNLTDAEREAVRLRGDASSKFVSGLYEWAVEHQIPGCVHALPPV
jgi:hypothetical protein